MFRPGSRGCYKYCGTAFVELPNTQAVLTGSEVETWCNDPRNSDLSPVLAMYAEGKRVVVNRGVVQRIQSAYSEQIAASKVMILIGVSYVPHDTHIWEPIAQHKPHVVVSFDTRNHSTPSSLPLIHGSTMST